VSESLRHRREQGHGYQLRGEQLDVRDRPERALRLVRREL
jgi:hypothetical protein